MNCPDCDDPLLSTFESTSGLGAQKQGDAFNTTPDSRHYVCFTCEKAWKQRNDGPLTPDVVGELTYFTCPDPDCGRAMVVTAMGDAIADVRLGCSQGHTYEVIRREGELSLQPAPTGPEPAGAD